MAATQLPTSFDVQRALLARGFDIGEHRDDGDIGPSTLRAIMEALERIPLPAGAAAPKPSVATGVIPMDWMPWCKMHGIVLHWSAGSNKPTKSDLEHYHFILDGEGAWHRGNHQVTDNVNTSDGDYAAHTLNANAGRIAVSLSGMKNAVESPFDAGPQPINRKQWDALPAGLADLCRRYTINVARETVLSHAEVPITLGIKQRGKWDIARLPFDPGLVGALAIGDQFRAATKALL